MLVRLLVFGMLGCAACAAGEEVDFSKRDAGRQRGGSSGTSGGGQTGSFSGTGGSTGATGGSGPTGTGGSGTGGGGRGGTGGGGPGGSGGSTKDAAAESGGRGGSSGTGGIAGTSGTGGSGPTSDAAVAGLFVQYLAKNSQASSPYVQCELYAKNTGVSSAPIAELKVRYYFTDEIKKTPKISMNWSHTCVPGNCSGPLMVTPMVTALSPPATNADSYIEFSLTSSNPTLNPGGSADFAFQMEGPNPASDIYTQSNDYSFDGAKTSATNWDRVVLLQNGNVIWGVPPP